eukprot:969234-Rhodomonas_salina.1
MKTKTDTKAKITTKITPANDTNTDKSTTKSTTNSHGHLRAEAAMLHGLGPEPSKVHRSPLPRMLLIRHRRRTPHASSPVAFARRTLRRARCRVVLRRARQALEAVGDFERDPGRETCWEGRA